MSVIYSGSNTIQLHLRCRPWDRVKEEGRVWDARTNPSGSLRNLIEIRDGRKIVFNEPLPGFPGERQLEKTRGKEFDADRSYPMEVDQEEVYLGSAAPLLDGIFNGYNATLMAYGATGCGKTHTMTGPATDPGIIPRAMQGIFDRKEAEEGEYEVSVKVSIIEVYNEKIHDLLHGMPSGTTTGGGTEILKVLTNPATKKGFVKAAQAEPRNLDEVRQLLDHASSRRATSATLANDTSSRSHQVMEITVERQPCCQGGESTRMSRGMLRIVDLAGSEKVHATEGHKDRAKEGKNINTSLHALSRVIELLAKPPQKAAIPLTYRDSVLTRLLESSLAGNCQTVMIVCVSPSSEHVTETHRSIQFATTAKAIKMASTANTSAVTARFKQTAGTVAALNAKVLDLEAQIIQLNKKLRAAGTSSSAPSNAEQDKTLRDVDSLRQEILRRATSVEQGAALSSYSEITAHLQQQMDAAIANGLGADAEGLVQLSRRAASTSDPSTLATIQQGMASRSEIERLIVAFAPSHTAEGPLSGAYTLTKTLKNLVQQEWRVRTLSAELRGYKQAALQATTSLAQVAQAYAACHATVSPTLQSLQRSETPDASAAASMLLSSLDAVQTAISASFASASRADLTTVTTAAGSTSVAKSFRMPVQARPIKRGLPTSASDSSMSTSSGSRSSKGKGPMLPRPVVAASPRKARAARVTYSVRGLTPKKDHGAEQKGVRWGGDNSRDEQPLEEIRVYARESSGSSQLSTLIPPHGDDEGEWSNVSEDAVVPELLSQKLPMVGPSRLAATASMATDHTPGAMTAPRIGNWEALRAQSRGPALASLVPIPLTSVDELEEGASSRESSGDQADAEVSETAIALPKAAGRLGPPSRAAAPLGARRTVSASTSALPAPLGPSKTTSARRTSYLAPTQSATNRAAARTASRGPAKPLSPPSKRVTLSSSTESQRENAPGLGPRRTPKTKRRFSGLPTRAVSNSGVRTLNLPGPSTMMNDVFAPAPVAATTAPGASSSNRTTAPPTFNLNLTSSISATSAPARGLMPIAESASVSTVPADATAAPSSALRNRASVANFGASTSRFQGAVSKRASMMNLGGAGTTATKALFKPPVPPGQTQPAPWR